MLELQSIMFTGLVTHKGKIKNILRSNQGANLDIQCPTGFLDDTSIGDSISVSGACLTVTGISDNNFTADISSESLNRTTILKWQIGRDVNLEKSLSASDKLGGHFVMGHVDGTGLLKKIESSGNSRIYRFETSPDILRMIVPKGSVSIDGVSLTPSMKDNRTFSIAVIPHTLERTTYAGLSIGEEVNIEVDIFARYIYEYLTQTQNQDQKKLNIDDLRAEGY